MTELTVVSANTNEVIASQPAKKNVSLQGKVNSILDNLDGKSGFTVGDVVILGKMSKEQRAIKLGLDANQYDVRVDSKNGIVNILEKAGSVANTWLRRQVDEKQANVSTSRLAPQGETPIKEVKNMDGSISYVLPSGHQKGSEWSGLTQRVFTVQNGIVKKIEVYDTDEGSFNSDVINGGEVKWYKVITINSDGTAKIKKYENGRQTSTHSEKMDMQRNKKCADTLLHGSYNEIINTQYSLSEGNPAVW